MSVHDNILPIRPALDEIDKDLTISEENKPETKEEKILRLQKMIDQGEYSVSSDEIAEALLDTAQDRIENRRKNSKK